MEATRGNGYAPVTGMPAMMSTRKVYKLKPRKKCRRTSFRSSERNIQRLKTGARHSNKRQARRWLGSRAMQTTKKVRPSADPNIL